MDKDGIIDNEYGLELAGGDQALADELLAMLISSLPDQKSELVMAHNDDDHDRMLHITHKINGATRYCGVPALRNAADILERKIKLSGLSDIKKEFEQLCVEIERLLNIAS